MIIQQFLIAASAAFFISIPSAQAQDTKAKGILEASSKKMKALKTLKAAFTLKMVSSAGKVRDTQKGTFLMKGQKYFINLTGQDIISDGKTVWTYMKDANEVQVSNYNASEQSISPTKLFTNFYDKEYSYKYVGTRKVAGKTCHIIDMTPVGTGKQFSKVELAIDNKYTIAGGNIFEKNGNQYQYEVTGFTANLPLPDTQFGFNAKAHPGVEVVDLR